MELAFEYAILASPLLLLAAVAQWKWSRRLALGICGLAVAAVTFVYSSIEWGGPGEANVGRGMAVIYGTIASGLALVSSILMFILNPPKPAEDAERELGS